MNKADSRQAAGLFVSLLLVGLGYLGWGSPGSVRMAGVSGPVARGLPGTPAQSPNRAPDVAFVGVHVLPMDRERVLEDQTVVVRGERILALGPRGSVEVPPGAEVIQGEGRFLMPGLAEMHAHVPPGDRPPPEVLEEILFLYLANGVTTIRGMLGSEYQLSLRSELESGEIQGPTFYVGAPSLNGNSAPTPEEAERKVRLYAEAGYDFLKIHPGITRPVWDRLVATAEEEGITFGGHIPQEVGLAHALETGQSTVDHLDGMVIAAASEAVQARLLAGETVPMGEVLASVTEEGIGEAVAATRRARAWLVPTSYLWMNLYAPVNTDSMLALPEMAYVSPAQREGWRRQKANAGSLSDSDARRLVEVRDRLLAEANRQGVGILMGTDSPQLFNVPGFALHREIRFMERAGMTPWEILASGTRNVADYVSGDLGLDGAFGTVAPGMRADLVLLEANPLEDLGALTRRAGVMVRGRWIPGAEIRARLDALARKHRG